MILHCAFSLTSSVEYPNMFSYFFPPLSTLLPGSALLKDGQIVYSTLLHLCCIQPAGTIVPFLRISQIWLLHKQCHSLRWRSTLSELDSLTLRLHLGEMLRFTLHGGMFSFTTVTNSWACIRKLSYCTKNKLVPAFNLIQAESKFLQVVQDFPSVWSAPFFFFFFYFFFSALCHRGKGGNSVH